MNATRIPFSPRWAALCWAAALTLTIGWIIPLLMHPHPEWVFPLKSVDALLFTVYIQKAAMGFTHGDTLILEHANNPESIFSFYHFWPVIYGKLYAVGGYPWLVVVSTLLSGLWFYSTFRFAERLSMPRPFAFFITGLQVFFVVNLAYQALGYKTNLAAYNLVTSEHSRLYPSVTAMAIYSAAALAMARLLQSPGALNRLVAPALIALVAYGRPFDWMVLMGALPVLVVLAWLRHDRAMVRLAIWTLVIAGLFSLPFVVSYIQYDRAHHAAYMDQIARGCLHVKNPSHYVKFAGLTAVVLGILAWAWRKCRLTEGGDDGGAPRKALLWLIAIIASSMLVHFKTLLDGGVTIVGFTYLMVFSTIPWFFLLCGFMAWRRLEDGEGRWFRSRVWPLFLIVALATQQALTGLERVPSSQQLAEEEDRRHAYDVIRTTNFNGRRPVVLTLGNGLEASALSESWLYLPTPTVAAYTCSAPTTELVERYLISKLLLTGTVKDLAPLFSDEGVSRVNAWIESCPDDTRFWIGLLRESVGANIFILHPEKNAGELRARNMRLPEALAKEKDFVGYFPDEMRRVFRRIEELDGNQERIRRELSPRYQLDFIFVPGPLKCHLKQGVYLSGTENMEWGSRSGLGFRVPGRLYWVAHPTTTPPATRSPGRH